MSETPAPSRPTSASGKAASQTSMLEMANDSIDLVRLHSGTAGISRNQVTRFVVSDSAPAVLGDVGSRTPTPNSA